MGLRLAILCLLRTVPGPGGFATHFGIKCSSFSKMNRGTSQRSACSSSGFGGYQSVRVGNMLLERIRAVNKQCINILKYNDRFLLPWRTCCLILLATALGGAWSLEQPSGSLLEFYPVFREMLESIFNCGGAHAVGVLDFREVRKLKEQQLS